MDLHYAIPSTYCQKALIAFYEKGVPFTPAIVSLTDPAGKAEYKKLYPLGKIPLLTGDDIFVPESTTIIEYLEDNYPGHGTQLIPSDKTQVRRVRFKDRMSDLYLNEPVLALFFDSTKPVEQRNPATVARAHETISVMFDFMDKELGENLYAQGNGFSMADCATFAPLFYAQQLHPFTDRPNIVKYFERLKERASVQRVLTELLPALAAMKT